MTDHSGLEVKLSTQAKTRWARFMIPLQLLFIAAGFAALAVAFAIGWGPF
jgi:hypothetical protein